MQSLQKSFTRQILSSQRLGITQVPVQYFAAKNVKDKTPGDEKNFINKQEQDILKNLLKKISTQQKEAEKTKDDRKTNELAELK